MRLLATCFMFVIAIGILLEASSASAWPGSARTSVAAADEIQVWALTDSKVYHCPGSRWYLTGEGKLMGECQAIAQGYKPAFGQGCGSKCLNTLQGSGPQRGNDEEHRPLF